MPTWPGRTCTTEISQRLGLPCTAPLPKAHIEGTSFHMLPTLNSKFTLNNKIPPRRYFRSTTCTKMVPNREPLLPNTHFPRQHSVWILSQLNGARRAAFHLPRQQPSAAHHTYHDLHSQTKEHQLFTENIKGFIRKKCGHGCLNSPHHGDCCCLLPNKPKNLLGRSKIKC